MISVHRAANWFAPEIILASSGVPGPLEM
jgi:hypothetical protein